MIQVVSDKDFTAKVVHSARPVLVDCWAQWCNTCRAMMPVLEELSVACGDKLSIVTLDVDENPVTTSSLGIVGLPTLVLYRNGKVVKQISGARTKAALLKDLAEFV